MKAFTITLVSILLVVGLAEGKDKERQWLVGHVVAYDTKSWTSTTGSNTTGHIDDTGNFQAGTTEQHWNHVTYYLTLNGGEYTYFAFRTLSWRFQHSPQMTENDDIKYTIEGDHLIVLGESGREFKMYLDKRRKN
jgi:hypothetical protein